MFISKKNVILVSSSQNIRDVEETFTTKSEKVKFVLEALVLKPLYIKL